MQPNLQIGRWLEHSVNNIRPGDAIDFKDLERVAREVLDGIYYTLARVGIDCRTNHNQATILAGYFHQQLSVRMIDNWPEVDSEEWKSFEVAEPEIALMVIVVRNYLTTLETVAASS